MKEQLTKTPTEIIDHMIELEIVRLASGMTASGWINAMAFIGEWDTSLHLRNIGHLGGSLDGERETTIKDS